MLDRIYKGRKFRRRFSFCPFGRREHLRNGSSFFEIISSPAGTSTKRRMGFFFSPSFPPLPPPLPLSFLPPLPVPSSPPKLSRKDKTGIYWSFFSSKASASAARRAIRRSDPRVTSSLGARSANRCLQTTSTIWAHEQTISGQQGARGGGAKKEVGKEGGREGKG